MKRNLVLLAMGALVGVSVGAPVDVTDRIESLGNPNGTTMDSRGRANTPWAMQAFDGGVYVGYGDYDYNAGPIPAWRYDCAQQKWINEGNLADEQIAFFYEFSDGNLYSPGIDDHGNYTLTGHVFRRKRGNPVWDQTVYTVSAQGQHNFSMAEYPNGRLWTAGYGICYADNYGNTTASGQWSKAVINDFAYPANEESADGIRVYPFVPFTNGLIVSLGYDYNRSAPGYTSSVNYIGGEQKYWKFNEARNEWDLFKFPFADMYPGFQNSTDQDRFTYTSDIGCIPGKALVFNGRTFYNLVARYSDYMNGVPWSGMWSATLENGRIAAKRLSAFPVGDAPVDFFVHNGRLYTLSMTYTTGANTITWHIRRTADGEHFTELYTWNAPQVYRSFAFQDGAIYLGVWTLVRWSGSPMASNVRESLKLGTICRFAAREVDTPFDTTGATVTTARGAITVSLPIANLVGEAMLTMKVDGEVIRSETATFADGVLAATKSGLRVGTYPVEVTMTVGDDTKTWSLTAMVTDSDFLEVGEPSAVVARDGKSAEVAIDILSLPRVSASIALSLNGKNKASRTVSQKGRETFSVTVPAGTTNNYVIAVSDGAETVSRSGQFIAAVYTNWFTVALSSKTSPDGVWTDVGEESAVFDTAACEIRSTALSRYVWTPNEASEYKADVEVSGRCAVRGAFGLSTPNEGGDAVAALAFEMSEEDDMVRPVLWTGSEWEKPLPSVALAEGVMVDWTVTFDYASADAVRVKLKIGDAVSDWISVTGGQTRQLTSIHYVGEGKLTEPFVGGFFSHQIGETGGGGIIVVPQAPEIATVPGADGKPPVRVENGTFTVTLANVSSSLYYTAFVCIELSSNAANWVAERGSVQPTEDGMLALNVSANETQKFVRIITTTAPVVNGTRLSELTQED